MEEADSKKFKVLLIHANTSMDTLIPPALATLAACIKKGQNEVKLFDTTFYNTRGFTGDDARVKTLQVKETNFEDYGIYFKQTNMVDDFLRMVEEYQPDLVGVSLVEVTFEMGMKLINAVKEAYPNIKVAAGGALPVTAPEIVIKEKNIDIVCIGEAENAFLELCDKLRKNEDYSRIANLWVKENGEITKNPLGNLVHINDLPYQDWDIFDESRIYKPMSGKIGRTGCFELTRGCAFSCTFCINEHLNKIHGNKNYRLKSIPKFIAEVKHFKDKYNLEFVYVLAEMFLPTTKERIREFSRLWKEEIGIPFWCQVRVEGVDEENARLLEEAGCTSVTAGVESGNEKYRNEVIDRRMSNEKIINAFRILKGTSMQVSGNSIIGFPDETREMIFDTIELNRQLNISNIMVHAYSPYRGTSLYELCVEKGYMGAQQLAGDYRSDYVLDMPHLSKEAVLGLHRTFSMYVKFPKDMWPEIKIAEKFDEEGNKKFEELSVIFKEKFFEKPMQMH